MYGQLASKSSCLAKALALDIPHYLEAFIPMSLVLFMISSPFDHSSTFSLAWNVWGLVKSQPACSVFSWPWNLVWHLSNSVYKPQLTCLILFLENNICSGDSIRKVTFTCMWVLVSQFIYTSFSDLGLIQGLRFTRKPKWNPFSDELPSGKFLFAFVHIVLYPLCCTHFSYVGMINFMPI